VDNLYSSYLAEAFYRRHDLLKGQKELTALQLIAECNLPTVDILDR
jgi:hypothetical protein